MKKETKLFLIISYLLNIVGFGGIILSNTPFGKIFNNPITIVLFLLGSLGPGIVGYILTKKENKEFKLNLNLENSTWLFFFVFLMAHFLLYKFLGNLNPINLNINIFIAIIISFIGFGIQEIGWVELVYSYFKNKKDRFRSIVANGLFKSLSFFPLVMLPGFMVRPESFAYFAALLVGLSAFSIFLREYSKSIIPSIIFISLSYGVMYFMDLNQGIKMFIIAFLECIIIYGLQDKLNK